MKKIIPLSISLMLFLTSCGSSMEHITSKQGFRLDYPSSWNVGVDLPSGISFIDKKTGGIVVASKKTMTDENRKSNEEILEWYKSQKTLVDSGKISFGGKDGMYIEYTNTYGTTSMSHRDAWGIDKDSLYSIGCTFKTKDKDIVGKLCDSMIASFQITQ